MDTKKKSHISTRWVILLFVVLILVAGSLYLWNGNIFGSRLPKFSSNAITTFTPLLPAEAVSNPTEKPVLSASPTPAPNVQAVCGQQSPMFILLLGIDLNEQADVIRLARVDFAKNKILLLSIPRDFYVPVPDLQVHDITEGKINATYGYGEYFFGQGQGVVEFSKTIYANYGINFDRYMVFHEADFSKLIDMVGGVDVVLDSPIGGYDFSGTHHFDGAAALDFAMLRDADNDDYRIDRQSVIIQALYQKMTQPENLLKLPALGLRILQEKMILTDLSLRDISTLSCLSKNLQSDSLVLKDIPAEFFKGSMLDGQYVRIPLPQATTYIQDLILNGNY